MNRRPSLEDFVLLSVLGTGNFGDVYLVSKPQTHEYFAMKVVKKKEIARHNHIGHTLSERNILTAVSHPCIVSLHYAFQTHKKVYFVLEYCPGGELYLHLRRATRFPVERARFYAACVLLALEHLHARNIVHRE